MAKNTEDMLKELKATITKFADESRRADDHWQQIADAINHSAKEFDRGLLKSITSFTGFAPAIQTVAKSFYSALTGNRDMLKQLAKEWVEANRSARMATNPDQKDMFAERADKLQRFLRANKTFSIEIGKVIKSEWAVAALAFAGELKLAFAYSKQINEQMIQTSADYANRARLAKEISHVQAATGNEMQDMAKAGAALANYGFDLRRDFSATLTTVVKMEEGLGVSYETSAQLAVMVKRIGGNFQAVADSVARIKADTALSADEATRFATQISKAVMLLKPGSGSLVSQTSDYISRIAAALKELTGNGQGFVDMLSSFTTEAGMMGAATLGATPDFLASPAQTKLVTERFVKYVNQQLSGTSGFQRMATIQLLADQFNTSADVISNANEMMKKYNETQKHKTSLEDEWRKQTSEIGKSLNKMYQSLSAIVQQTLIPVIRYLNPVMETLVTGLQYVAKSSAALYIGIGLLSLSAAGAFITVTRLTAALWRFAATSGIMGNLSGGAGLASTVTTWLPRIGSVLLRLGGPIIAAAAAGYALGTLIDKGLKKIGLDIGEIAANARKDTFREQTQAYTAGGMTRNDILKNVSAMAASGKSVEDIQNFILKNASSVKGIHGEALTKERREKILDSIIQDAGREITRQRVRVGYTTLTEQSALDKERDLQMIELYKAIAANTNLHNQILERTEKKHENIEQSKRRDLDEVETEKRLERLAREKMMDNISRGSGFRTGY